MKIPILFRRFGLVLSVTAAFLGVAQATRAQLFNFDFQNVNRDIPDGDLVGTSVTEVITPSPGIIDELKVFLEIVGEFNGDLYLQLNHAGQHAVLLNRVGRRASDVLGYADSGMNIQLWDNAPSGDIHNYRFALSGDHLTPLTSALTGVWAPDGRAVDPTQVLDTDSPSALLSMFKGLDPNGSWTLYLADLETGGQSTLVSWGMEISVAPVPEPRGGAVALGCACLALAWHWRAKRVGGLKSR